jgi:hypothetical protein
VALEILGSDGNTACQLILVGVPELTGAGAIQVAFCGRADNPDKTLLDADEPASELPIDELATEFPWDDWAEDPPLPPPPPHEKRNRKLDINNNFFTQFSMVITSQNIARYDVSNESLVNHYSAPCP